MKLVFQFEKRTNGGTFRFKEDAEHPKCGTLYLKKEAAQELGIVEGDSIAVAIEKEEGK